MKGCITMFVNPFAVAAAMTKFSAQMTKHYFEVVTPTPAILGPQADPIARICGALSPHRN